jgi:excisionase family DNA binding protein
MKEQRSNLIEKPILLRVTDVARLMSISRSMAYQLVQRGEIPSVRIKNSVRVKAADLEEYIRQNYSGWVQNGSGI